MRGPGDLVGTFRRRRAARSLPDGPVRRYLDTPLPSARTPLDELRLLAVDVETTGLDPRRDRVLSVGFVPVDGDRIVLGGAGSTLVRPPSRDQNQDDDDEGVGQSATVHGLTDDAVAVGSDPAEVLDLVFTALDGRVLLAHYSRIEIDFLGALCRRVYGTRPPLQTVDTLELHLWVLAGDRGRASTVPGRDELRLWAARERYGLPMSSAHDALADAVACAELYLAQIAELSERGVRTLGEVRTP